MSGNTPDFLLFSTVIRCNSRLAIIGGIVRRECPVYPYYNHTSSRSDNGARKRHRLLGATLPNYIPLSRY
eukprot:2226656-Pyramimonas_sp.AAC.1